MRSTSWRPVSQYVTSVVALATVAAAWAVCLEPARALPAVAVWAVAAAVSQLISFDTLTRSGQVSLGTCVHLCMIVLLVPGEFVPALALGCLLAQPLQRRPWIRTLFNAAQLTLSVLAGWIAYRIVGGPPRPEPTLAGLLTAAPAFVCASLAYYATNRLVVSGVLALTTGRTLLRAWQENVGYRAELAGTAALVLLTPMAVLAYLNLGGAGLALLLVPLLLIRDASQRYVELRRTRRALVEAERLAAKGELAAEVGHAINNCLTVVDGQIQLLLLKSGRISEDELRGRLGRAAQEVSRIHGLSRELIDFTRLQHTPRPTALRGLIEDTIAPLTHQRRFEGIRVDLDLDPRVPEVRVDPDQLQLLLLTLVDNAAEAFRGASVLRRVIRVRLHLDDAHETLELEVSDTGPGVPRELRRRIFEPGFTTRPDGRGFGLSTVLGIVRNYGGGVHVVDDPAGGATFRVSLPWAGVGLAPLAVQSATRHRRTPGLSAVPDARVAA